MIEPDRQPARMVRPDQASSVAKQVGDVKSRASAIRGVAPVTSEMMLPEAPTFDPNEDQRRVRDLEEQNDRLLRTVLFQQEKRDENSIVLL